MKMNFIICDLYINNYVNVYSSASKIKIKSYTLPSMTHNQVNVFCVSVKFLINNTFQFNMNEN